MFESLDIGTLVPPGIFAKQQHLVALRLHAWIHQFFDINNFLLVLSKGLGDSGSTKQFQIYKATSLQFLHAQSLFINFKFAKLQSLFRYMIC